jgi:hypothetical protein
MTILQGTMSDGTVIPVQVDAQGRLVAEGLQGPAGPQGPPGADGSGLTLPPNPHEGWALGWKNGQLTWLELVPAPDDGGWTAPIKAVQNTTTPNYAATLEGYETLQDPQKAFDGDLYNTSAGGMATGGNRGMVTWRAESYGLAGDIGVATQYGDECSFNGGPWTPINSHGPFTVGTGSLLSVAVRATANGFAAWLKGVTVDGVALVGNRSTTILTFSGGEDLSRFTAGMAVTEVGSSTDAAGTVTAVEDSGGAAPKLVLAVTAGTWTAGAKVKGPA